MDPSFIAFLAAVVVGLGVSVLLVIVLLVAVFVFVVLMAVVFFWTGRVLLPKLTLLALNLLEDPITFIFGLFRFKPNTVSAAIISMRNRIFDQTASHVDKKDRMLFLPYCLRSRECPAKLEEDGLMCIMCGRCDIGKIKKEAMAMGYEVYVVPGSSLIKKIINKKRPKAVVGVGCHSEVRAGASKMTAIGMPAKGLILEKDGCIDTVVDVPSLIELLKV